MSGLYAVLVFATALFGASGRDKFDITDEEYLKLPELFAADNYDRCLSQSKSVFCMGTFKLSAAGPSEMMDVLTKYSENTLEHYNRTKIERCTCLGPHSRCRLQEGSSWQDSFVSCVQEDMARYGLNAHALQVDYCRSKHTGRKMDAVDWTFIYYAIALLSLNVAATVYDIFKEGSEGNPWLLSFSIVRNWKRFVGSETVSPTMRTFQSLHGFKGMLSTFVILAHVPVGLFIFNANPRQVEQMGHKPYSIVLYNGTVIIQQFVLMSAFLRAYQMTAYVKSGGSLRIDAVLKAIMDRIVRIGPLYFTAVGFTATVAAFTGAGAIWPRFVEGQADACREMFWVQMLWIQNFFPPKCVPQAWYLSIDMQFCIVCTALMVLLHRKENKIAILTRMFFASIALLFCIVYALELQPSLFFVNPESVLKIFSEQRSFHLLYQSIWGNLPTTLMGMIAGILFHDMERADHSRLKESRLLKCAFSLGIPLAFAYVGSGWFFLSMESRLAVSLYATLVQPLFALTIGLPLLCGCVFKLDSYTRTLLEWRGWEPLSRASLASLLLHGGVNRAMASTNIYPPTVTVGGIFTDWFSIAVVTFLLSVPACILIEYPFTNMWRVYWKRALKTEAAKVDRNGNIDGHATLDSNGANLDSNGANLDSNGANLDSSGANLDSNGNGDAKLDSNGNGDVTARNGHKIKSNGRGLSKNGHAKVQ